MFLVFRIDGEYSDKSFAPVAVFKTREGADAFLDRIETHVARVSVCRLSKEWRRGRLECWAITEPKPVFEGMTVGEMRAWMRAHPDPYVREVAETWCHALADDAQVNEHGYHQTPEVGEYGLAEVPVGEEL